MVRTLENKRRVRSILEVQKRDKLKVHKQYYKHKYQKNYFSYFFLFYFRNLLNKLDKQLQRLLHHTRQLLIILDTINIKIIKIIKFYKHFILNYYYISNYHNYIYLIL